MNWGQLPLTTRSKSFPETARQRRSPRSPIRSPYRTLERTTDLRPTRFRASMHCMIAGAKVLMVGDGLNDAPALTAAHASLSPASAADISQTTADAIFQGDNLAASHQGAFAVAKAARRTWRFRISVWPLPTTRCLCLWPWQVSLRHYWRPSPCRHHRSASQRMRSGCMPLRLKTIGASVRHDSTCLAHTGRPDARRIGFGCLYLVAELWPVRRSRWRSLESVGRR